MFTIFFKYDDDSQKYTPIHITNNSNLPYTLKIDKGFFCTFICDSIFEAVDQVAAFPFLEHSPSQTNEPVFALPSMLTFYALLVFFPRILLPTFASVNT